MSGYGSFLDQTLQETNTGSSAWLSSNTTGQGPPAYHQQSNGTPSESSQDLSRVYSQIISALEKLTEHSRNISAFNNKLGTKKDTQKLRKKLNKEIENGTQAIKAVTKSIASLPRDDHRRSRFKHDLEHVTEQMKDLIQDSAQKKRTFLARSKEEQKRMKKQRTFINNPNSLSPEERQHFLEQQQKQQEVLQLDNEIAYNEGLIKEREAEVMDIEANVHDINTIFKELHHMMNDQGDDLNLIEDKVIKTALNIEKGNTNLGKANKHDKKGRFLICLILLVVLGIALAVLAFFALAFAFHLL